jgi:hypothetical protein
VGEVGEAKNVDRPIIIRKRKGRGEKEKRRRERIF